MSEVVIVAMISCVGTALTLLGAFWASRSKNKTDMSINHRKSLSEDEQKFRTDLITEVDSYRDKIEALMDKVDKLSEANVELKGTNMKLMAKVDALQETLNQFSHTTSTSTNSSTETYTVSNPAT